MCGIGTTLVEAVHLGRRAVGIEYEPHWVDVARANLALAHTAGLAHDGRVFHGDARQIASLLPPEYVGQAALVVTSPPYGPSTHGQVAVAPGAGVQKYHHLYGNTLDRGNLANIGHHRLLSGFTRILTGLVPYLRPGGHIAITIRPWREHAELIDLPSQILACGIHAGLIPVERCVALLARAAEHDLIARGSFFQRDFIRKQRDAGLPLHLISHEDVLIFRTYFPARVRRLASAPRFAGDQRLPVCRGSLGSPIVMARRLGGRHEHPTASRWGRWPPHPPRASRDRGCPTAPPDPPTPRPPGHRPEPRCGGAVVARPTEGTARLPRGQPRRSARRVRGVGSRRLQHRRRSLRLSSSTDPDHANGPTIALAHTAGD
jgi:hypothetical protein